MTRNPFELVTASKLSAEAAAELWCDDKRLARVHGKENCFINGHRGTGKSMLFRILQYDCQKLLHPDREPDFLGVYFSVRDSELMTEELGLFQEDSQKNIISESHFSLLILKQLFLVIQSNPSLVSGSLVADFSRMIRDSVSTAFQFCTVEEPTIRNEYSGLLADMLVLFEIERQRIVDHVVRRLYEHAPFDGPLFLFDTLLGPIANFLKERAAKTLYILVDDGDDLPESHTIVLNTWIARRHGSVVFKVSTMFGYKTYRTRGRSAIQHPHDFTQYDIATRYLADRSEDYVELLRNITEKRLRAISVNVTAEAFFPEDEHQRKALLELSDTLSREYEERYSGRSIKDYVYRHLTSEYIKRTLLPRSSSSYLYSGFSVLATLSSGLVRDFIICAQRMYDNASREHDSPQFIPPRIQSETARYHADLVLDEIGNQKQKRSVDSTREEWQEIKRMIEGLGNIFKGKMLSEDSERRVFSFSFQDEPPARLGRLLDLAIGEGYLMKGFISRKEGTGRRALYVLTRRLAPAFNLDVSAYSGYLSITSERLVALIEHGPQPLDEMPTGQLTLFGVTEFIDSLPPGELGQKVEWVRISPEEAGE